MHHTTESSAMANGTPPVSTLQKLALQPTGHPEPLPECPIERTKTLLENDTKIKVAGLDFDGILRGKIISKDKFFSSLKGGFGMSSAVYGWDMHDVLYSTDAGITSATEGYADMDALVDLDSFRRLPFEDDIAFFLLRFEIRGKMVCADGRGLMKTLDDELAKSDIKGLAGG